jgi:hypothetical protein
MYLPSNLSRKQLLFAPLGFASSFYTPPGGLEEAFRSMSSPAQNLEPLTGALTYSMADLEQTARRFSEQGVSLPDPDEVADQLPLYPKPLPRSRKADCDATKSVCLELRCAAC